MIAIILSWELVGACIALALSCATVFQKCCSADIYLSGLVVPAFIATCRVLAIGLERFQLFQNFHFDCWLTKFDLISFVF